MSKQAKLLSYLQSGNEVTVKQISGVANQRLTDDQREDYTASFRQALRIREEQLGSNS